MKKDTKCIHSGYKPQNGEPRVFPIVQSTTYAYDNSAELGELFNLQKAGHIYTRMSNPTLDVVEKKIADLEGGVGAMLTSSGQAATTIAVLNICGVGDNIICTNAVYGGTFNLFDKTIKAMGVDVKFVSVNASEEEIQSLIDEKTKAVFSETLCNPSLVITDIEKFAKIAHKNQIPLIVDNTFPTPINCNPFDFGADIIIHSTSKYMDGHAVSLGGVIIDSGKFNWKTGKFPQLTNPDESYHGIVYTEHFGEAGYIAKARCHLLRDLGATASPTNAFYLNLGLETLALRMERHSFNALKVAEFLETNDKIAWVNYPMLKSSSQYELAQKYMPNGASGVVSFGVKGGREIAAKFMDNLELATIVTHVADLRTTVIHPASTTHRQLNDEQLASAGVSAEMIRLSVGIENIEDILTDIKNALSKI